MFLATLVVLAGSASAAWQGVAFPYSRAGCQSPSLRAAGLEPVMRLPAFVHPLYGTTPTMYISFGAKEVECMGVVSPDDAREPPKIIIEGLENGNYSIIMVGYDEPSADVPREIDYPYLSWIVIDAFLEDNVLDLAVGKHLVPYEPPRPTDGSTHRYFINAVIRRADFNGPDRLLSENADVPSQRAKFHLDQWLGTNGLIMRSEAGFVFQVPTSK
jgi:hypothetical protein